jgi:cytoskeletal protein CcmA (bactofilin family)
MADKLRRRLRDRSGGPATLIGEDCRITGNITGAGNYLVSGHVEGNCDIEGTTTITRNGRWKGLIKSESVVVAGTVEGDIVASGNVEVGNTAKIFGSVSGEAVAVAEGAVVEGVMTTTGKTDPVTFVEKRKSDPAD